MLPTAGARASVSGRQTPALLPDTCTLIGKGHWQRASSAGPQGECRADRPPPRGRPVISHTQWRGAVHAAGSEGAAVANTAGLPSHSLRALETQARDPRRVGHSHSSAPKGAYHLWNSRATLGRHLRDPGRGRGLPRVRPEAHCRPSCPADPGPCRAAAGQASSQHRGGRPRVRTPRLCGQSAEPGAQSPSGQLSRLCRPVGAPRAQPWP